MVAVPGQTPVDGAVGSTWHCFHQRKATTSIPPSLVLEGSRAQGSSQGCGSESRLFVLLPLPPPYSTLHFPADTRLSTWTGSLGRLLHSSHHGALTWLSLPVHGAGPAPAHKPWWLQVRGHTVAGWGPAARTELSSVVVALCLVLRPLQHCPVH